MLDTFGYAGNNPHYTYRRNDQYYNGSNGWQSFWLALNTINPVNAGHDTLYNYYANGADTLPSSPSQILVAAYNPDSTLDQVAYYNGVSPTPAMVYQYYYSLPPAAGVAANSTSREAIRVYPLPAAFSQTVSIAVDGLSGRGAYSIFNVEGKVVLHGTIEPGKVLSIQNLPIGHYVFQCGAESSRIIVQ
jgi:hypothetical protein